MGSIEVGQPNKHLSYLNLSKTGLTYKNEGHQDFCEITMDFANSPWLQKQSDYLMSISRFTVPLHEVPIIDTMPAAIEVWPFPHLDDDNTKWESSAFKRNAGMPANPVMIIEMTTTSGLTGRGPGTLFFRNGKHTGLKAPRSITPDIQTTCAW